MKMKKSVKIFCIMALFMLCIGMGSVRAQAADVTLKDGKWTKGVLKEEKTEQYYKIRIKKAGYIMIACIRDSEDGLPKFYLCNGKKKPLTSQPVDSVDDITYFAVKKGTYYIKVSDKASEYDKEDNELGGEENYKIGYKFTAMKDSKKPVSMKKAQLLKKNKQVSGLVFLEKKPKDIYYKLTLTKKTVVKFKYDIMSTDSMICLRIADKKGNWLNFDSKRKVIKTKKKSAWWDGKGSDYIILPKGTYYFTIWTISDESGYYKLSVNW